MGYAFDRRSDHIAIRGASRIGADDAIADAARWRARLVLLLAEGLPYRTIQQRLDTTAPTIARWRRPFLRQRIAGLLEILIQARNRRSSLRRSRRKCWRRRGG